MDRRQVLKTGNDWQRSHGPSWLTDMSASNQECICRHRATDRSEFVPGLIREKAVMFRVCTIFLFHFLYLHFRTSFKKLFALSYATVCARSVYAYQVIWCKFPYSIHIPHQQSTYSNCCFTNAKDTWKNVFEWENCCISYLHPTCIIYFGL